VLMRHHREPSGILFVAWVWPADQSTRPMTHWCAIL
jgi:hypothetical protein